MTPNDLAQLLERLRARRPRIHCLMNTVAQKLTADGLSAIGATPSMTASIEEVADFAARADATLVNLGTMTAEMQQAIGLGLAALQPKPWVLDPVFCDVSPLRLTFAMALLANQPAAIRGNMSEMALFSPRPDTVHIQTGAQDRITLGNRQVQVLNGHPWLAAVSGTGCLSGALVAAFMTVTDDRFAAAAAGMVTLGIAAEQAASYAHGPGSFAPALLDALYYLTPDDIINKGQLIHGHA